MALNLHPPRQIAEEFNKFFTTAPQKIVDKIPRADPPLPKFINPIKFSMADSPITETEIIEATKQLLPKKSEDFNVNCQKIYHVYCHTSLSCLL